jgi:Tol biopolymer transport system component
VRPHRLTQNRMLGSLLLSIFAALISGCAGAKGNLLTSLISRDATVDGTVVVDTAPLADVTLPPDLQAPDIPIRPTVCLPWGDAPSFYPPQALSAVNTSSNEMAPFVTADALRLFFSSDRQGGPGGGDVYMASRPDPDTSFGPGALVEGVNTADDDGAFSLTPDGLTAYMSSSRPGGMGQADIWTASRQDPQAPFSASDFSPLAEVNNEGRQFDPFLSTDGLRLYFTTDGILESGSLADIAVAERSISAGIFGEPTAVAGLDMEAVHDANPSLTGDQLMIVFSSNRPGGPGGSDLWYATRDSADAAFSEPRLLSPLSTSDSEGEVFITPDACEIYFARDLNGQRDLFVARFRSQ